MIMDDETQQVFREETEALVESLLASLLSLKKTADPDLVSQVFRDLHTLKGTGAMFGHTRLAGFIHDFEAAYDAVRSGRAALSSELIDVSLKAYDLIVDLLAGQDVDEAQEAALKVDLAVATGAAAAPAAAPDEAGSPEEAAEAEEAVPTDWRLHFFLPDDILEIGGDPLLLLDELREIGGPETAIMADIDHVPPLADLDISVLEIGWIVTLPGDVPEQDIRDVFMFHEDRMELSLERGAAASLEAPAPEPEQEPEPELTTETEPAPESATAPEEPISIPAPVDARPAENVTTEKPSAPTPPPAEPQASRPSAPAKSPAQAERAEVTSMRVPSSRLDDIMDRVGELVIAEARLADVASRISDPNLFEVAESIQRLAMGLRDSSMSMRLSPISGITGRFKRLAIDLAEKTGKDFDFVIEGGETELDKSVLDRLTDPLVHILRNSVDHGIEKPDVRRDSGKPERGTIKLSARYSGAEVLISVSDDGRGLDPDFIRERAIARGMISADRTLQRNQIFALLMEPGFSTAETVTDLSGRGVGTDVVKTTVESLRGSIDIESELGQGTTFTLRLPLTLAIIEGLLVQIGNERYTVPLSAVEGIVEAPEHLKTAHGTSTIMELREKQISVLKMREIFTAVNEEPAYPKVVLVRAGGRQIGLAVDQIIGSHQTVIKQLSPLHSRLGLFSGATILADGNVALIIDVTQLARRQSQSAPVSKEIAA